MVKPDAPLLSWLFTAISSAGLIIMFVVSFIRYRHKRQVKRSREQEYIKRFSMLLPGYSYRDKKKSLARKIMTNTHAISMTDLCLSPVGLHSSHPRLPESQFGQSVGFEQDKADVSIYTAAPPKPYHLPDHLISQNSNDTTSDDEKPLVRPKSSSISRAILTDIPDRALIAENVRRNTKEQVLNNKRQQKTKPERKKHHPVSDVNMDNNFNKMSLDFADTDKQNYIVYSSNEHGERRQSFPVDAVPTPDGIVSSTSFPSISISDHYIDSGDKYAKVKSKHGKGHKDGPRSDRHGKKHKKHGVQGNRPRSLPQLDDVYFANVYDDSMAAPSGSHNPGYIPLSKQAEHSASIDIDNRVFVKRKPLVAQRAHAQSEPTIPLRSFPFISQSEDSEEKYRDFNSEYM